MQATIRQSDGVKSANYGLHVSDYIPTQPLCIAYMRPVYTNLSVRTELQSLTGAPSCSRGWIDAW